MYDNDSKCLYCYEPLKTSEEIHSHYHSSCCKKIFEKAIPPKLDFSQDDIDKIAQISVQNQKTIPGVQPKLSLQKSKASRRKDADRLTVIDYLGEYILKPQTQQYSELPKIEDLTMHLAQSSGIRTATHSLVYLNSGELAYLCKRMDRYKGKKIHMEDMCQLSNRLTEHKYKGSYEQIAKLIAKYSENPGLDIINFYEMVLFSFLTGNNDMHLKNFSLIKNSILNYQLAPAYDLVAAQLVVENDPEELALTLDGKKKNINISNFINAMKSSGINNKSIENVFKSFTASYKTWKLIIDKSFISIEMKEKYHSLLEKTFKQLKLL